MAYGLNLTILSPHQRRMRALQEQLGAQQVEAGKRGLAGEKLSQFMKIVANMMDAARASPEKRAEVNRFINQQVAHGGPLREPYTTTYGVEPEKTLLPSRFPTGPVDLETGQSPGVPPAAVGFELSPEKQAQRSMARLMTKGVEGSELSPTQMGMLKIMKPLETPFEKKVETKKGERAEKVLKMTEEEHEWKKANVNLSNELQKLELLHKKALIGDVDYERRKTEAEIDLANARAEFLRHQKEHYNEVTPRQHKLDFKERRTQAEKEARNLMVKIHGAKAASGPVVLEQKDEEFMATIESIADAYNLGIEFQPVTRKDTRFWMDWLNPDERYYLVRFVEPGTESEFKIKQPTPSKPKSKNKGSAAGIDITNVPVQ